LKKSAISTAIFLSIAVSLMYISGTLIQINAEIRDYLQIVAIICTGLFLFLSIWTVSLINFRTSYIKILMCILVSTISSFLINVVIKLTWLSNQPKFGFFYFFSYIAVAGIIASIVIIFIRRKKIFNA